MKNYSHKMVSEFAKKVLVVLALFSMANYVFAVDGTMDGGKKSSKAYSTLKSDLSFSLKSGYLYRGNKNFGTKRYQNTITSNSVITYQRGNITWVFPHRNKTSILQKFKTPTPPLR
jgi:hypothetical protein